MLPINAGNKATMSSREIAELVQSRHSDVMKSIERLMDSGAIQGYAATPYTHEQNGQTYDEYLVYKRDSYVIVAQLSPTFTAALVDRWQELEQEKALGFNPNDQIAVLEHFLLEKKKSQALQIENDSLKNLFVDGMTPAQFAKSLNGVNCQKINSHLANERKWLFNSGKSLTEYDWRVASYARDNYLTEKPVKINRLGKDEKMKYQPILLKKGAAKIYSMYIAGELPMKANWNGLHTHDKSVRIAG
nr:Rha family transcriptional regulator [Morganella morganii]